MCKTAKNAFRKFKLQFADFGVQLSLIFTHEGHENPSSYNFHSVLTYGGSK
jgi:hypothetical protein